LRNAVEAGLPLPDAPFEWATYAGSWLYTSHVPILSDGTFETGDAEAQAVVTFGNLRKAVEAAGGSLDDVVQVLISITDSADFPAINSVYRTVFSPPFPNRATVVVAGLLAPGTVIEIVATAYRKTWSTSM
jgi:enamine deaminase RidA (YjgF/YER057c/UK114 family)